MKRINQARPSHVKVLVRLRPQSEAEASVGGSVACNWNEQTVGIVSPSDSARHLEFEFDRVFSPAATQAEVYEHTGRLTVDDLFEGYNGTIFAYGQTGSGKTHTILGPPSTTTPQMSQNRGDPGRVITAPAATLPADRTLWGVAPRAVAHLFRRIAEADSELEFMIRVYAVEIYRDRVYDLLDRSKTNLPIHEDVRGGRGVYVAGVSEEYVGTAEEVLALLRVAASQRMTATTAMNDASSRSHMIFCISVTQKHRVEMTQKTGKLYLVDLAGSEKVSKTKADGTRLDEAKTINKSLSTLAQVINSLLDRKSTYGPWRGRPVDPSTSLSFFLLSQSQTPTPVPYRDSKLTRLLADSLGGNSRTTLVANISPSSANAAESLSSLRFAVRVKKVTNHPRVNRELSEAELRAALQAAEAELVRLRASAARSGSTDRDRTCPIDGDWLAEKQALLDELSELRRVLDETEDARGAAEARAAEAEENVAAAHAAAEDALRTVGSLRATVKTLTARAEAEAQAVPPRPLCRDCGRDVDASAAGPSGQRGLSPTRTDHHSAGPLAARTPRTAMLAATAASNLLTTGLAELAREAAELGSVIPSAAAQSGGSSGSQRQTSPRTRSPRRAVGGSVAAVATAAAGGDVEGLVEALLSAAGAGPSEASGSVADLASSIAAAVVAERSAVADEQKRSEARHEAELAEARNAGHAIVAEVSERSERLLRLHATLMREKERYQALHENVVAAASAHGAAAGGPAAEGHQLAALRDAEHDNATLHLELALAEKKLAIRNERIDNLKAGLRDEKAHSHELASTFRADLEHARSEVAALRGELLYWRTRALSATRRDDAPGASAGHASGQAGASGAHLLHSTSSGASAGWPGPLTAPETDATSPHDPPPDPSGSWQGRRAAASRDALGASAHGESLGHAAIIRAIRGGAAREDPSGAFLAVPLRSTRASTPRGGGGGGGRSSRPSATTLVPSIPLPQSDNAGGRSGIAWARPGLHPPAHPPNPSTSDAWLDDDDAAGDPESGPGPHRRDGDDYGSDCYADSDDIAGGSDGGAQPPYRRPVSNLRPEHARRDEVDRRGLHARPGGVEGILGGLHSAVGVPSPGPRGIGSASGPVPDSAIPMRTPGRRLSASRGTRSGSRGGRIPTLGGANRSSSSRVGMAPTDLDIHLEGRGLYHDSSISAAYVQNPRSLRVGQPPDGSMTERSGHDRALPATEGKQRSALRSRSNSAHGATAMEYAATAAPAASNSRLRSFHRDEEESWSHGRQSGTAVAAKEQTSAVVAAALASRPARSIVPRR